MSEPGGGISPEDGGGGSGGGGGGGGTGGGAAGMLTVLSRTITMTVAGIVDVEGAAIQSFSAVPAAWLFELWIDGEVIWSPAGTYPGDVVPISGVKYCEAGPRLVELKWAAAPQITLRNRFLKIRGFNNVSG